MVYNLNNIDELVKDLRRTATIGVVDKGWYVNLLRSAADIVKDLARKSEVVNVNRNRLVLLYDRGLKLLSETPLQGNERCHEFVCNVLETLVFLLNSVDSTESHT